MSGESNGLSVDLNRYVQKISEQRNGAMDELAKLFAYIDQLTEENTALRVENTRLASENAHASARPGPIHRDQADRAEPDSPA